jgi:hypothetical protein
VTVTQDILAVVGLVRSLDKPLKVLGHGDVTRPLFVVADAFSKSAAAKIEAAGGTAQVMEFPGRAESADAAEPEASAEVAPAKPAKPARAARAEKSAAAAEAATATPDEASDSDPEKGA